MWRLRSSMMSKRWFPCAHMKRRAGDIAQPKDCFQPRSLTVAVCWVLPLCNEEVWLERFQAEAESSERLRSLVNIGVMAVPFHHNESRQCEDVSGSTANQAQYQFSITFSFSLAGYARCIWSEVTRFFAFQAVRWTGCFIRASKRNGSFIKSSI